MVNLDMKKAISKLVNNRNNFLKFYIVRNYSTVLKIAPAFLLAGTMMQAQVRDSAIKERKIEEVVLVGYGAKKKTDLTGAITALSEKDFNKGAITSAEGLLNGRTSGVVVTQSGTPGNEATIRIRGGSSLLSSNDPLIVIDGLPVSGGLSSVNPNDIESFSILKDASSTAIYGNRGSNGVILITTKKGSKRKLQVSLNSFVTYNTLAKKVDTYSADEFRKLIAENAPSRVGLLGNANTDWQDLIFRNTATFDSNLSVMGNLFNTIPSRLSIGQTENEGILLTSLYRRSTASVSLNPTFFDNHLKINVTGNYTYAFKRNADEGAIGNAISYDPTQAVYDETSIFDGYREWIANNKPVATANPVALLRQKRDIGNHHRFFGNVNVDYKFHFLPDLRLIVNAGMDKQDGNGTLTIDKFSRSGYINVPNQGLQHIGVNQNTWYSNLNKNLNVQLNYAKKIGDWNVDVLGGYEYQNFEFKSFNSSNKLMYELDPNNNVADVYTQVPINLQAFFGRLNLGLKNNRYLLTVNYRKDGSSRFSKENRWGDFGGAALAWKMNEDFFADNQTVNELKLRLSVGLVGQQDIGDYRLDYMKEYFVSQNAYYPFGFGDNSYYPVAKPKGYNESLTWETSTKYNAGIDYALFNRRLSGTLDFYLADTKDLLSIVAEGAGQNLRVLGPKNIGSLQSKGVDLGINYKLFRNENFTMNLNYNLTYNHLEIKHLHTETDQVGGVGYSTYVQTYRVGLAPYAFWVFQQVYDNNGKPIEGAYVDRNNDGVITTADKYNFKKPNADVTMGLMIDGTFAKNWDYSMAWRASFGNYVYDLVNSSRAFLEGGIYNKTDNVLNNTSKDYDFTRFSETNRTSDYYIKNASFLKLDNVTLGYTIRNNNFIGDRTSLRLYGGVQNALIITKYKNLDPEVFNNGMDGMIYPRARMFMLGVNVNF
ncbi:SusC/RagA family TonB-linked outer membrane protein [Bergeyella porcorum]